MAKEDVGHVGDGQQVLSEVRKSEEVAINVGDEIGRSVDFFLFRLLVNIKKQGRKAYSEDADEDAEERNFMFLTARGIRRMVVLNAWINLLYSSIASWPKEKNATKMKVEIGRSHHEALNERRIKVGVYAVRNWSTRRKSECTNPQFFQRRKGRVIVVNQKV